MKERSCFPWGMLILGASMALWVALWKFVTQVTALFVLVFGIAAIGWLAAWLILGGGK